MANVLTTKIPLPARKLSLPTGLEISELIRMSQQVHGNPVYTADNSSTSSDSSLSSSPNGKLNATISGEVDSQSVSLDANFLLKQMNKRKLHLPCPLCNSVVVNMSDHLAKTHMIVDFKQRKVLLNMVRCNHVMNPTNLKQLIENNKHLLAKGENSETADEAGNVKTVMSNSSSVESSCSNQIGLAGFEWKYQELMKLARGGGNTAAVYQQPPILTPDQSDIDRFSEESETNNTKPDSSPDSSRQEPLKDMSVAQKAKSKRKAPRPAPYNRPSNDSKFKLNENYMDEDDNKENNPVRAKPEPGFQTSCQPKDRVEQRLQQLESHLNQMIVSFTTFQDKFFKGVEEFREDFQQVVGEIQSIREQIN